ncbi:hypothetical protein [Photorhabdus khanii]|nr:hypothetical protein [Photorhabdus khanii]
MINITQNTALKSVNGWWKCGDTEIIYQWGYNPKGGPGQIQ